MKRIVPRFFRDFHCIADQCSDSCCIGWEIDIDEDSLRHYEGVQGDFGARLRREIVAEDGVSHFRLKEQGRCAFLNDRNLCDLYIALDEEHLCDICREHPRFYEWFSGRVEAGLGLCCEEACRLLLADSAPLTFVEEQTDEPDEEFDGEAELLEELEPLREELYVLLQDRSLAIWRRIGRVVPILEQKQDEWDGFPPAEDGETEWLPGEVELIELCEEMEPIDEGWTHLVERMRGAGGEPISVPDWMVEHAAVYLTYRWLLKAAFDGDVLGKGQLIVRFVCLMKLLLDKGLVSSAEEALRLLSKEIEYSQENTALASGQA